MNDETSHNENRPFRLTRLVLRGGVSACILTVLLCPGSVSAGAIVRILQEGGTRQERICTLQGCQVVNVQQRGWWSGTVIGRAQDNRLNVLTVAHGLQQNRPVTVFFEQGNADPAPGEICCVDHALDLALIAVQRDRETEWFPIGDKGPPNGAQLTIAGYGDGPFRLRQAEMKGYLNSNTIIINATLRQGTSGGPVFWGDRIVGVLQGNSHGNGVAASHAAVQKFVTECAAEGPAQVMPEPAPLSQADAPAIKPSLELPAATAAELTAVLAKLNAIERRMSVIERTPGPTGPPGPPGPQGEAGAPAQSNSADDREGLSAIKERLTTLEATRIPVRIYGPDRKVISQKSYRLGDPIEFGTREIQKK